MKTYLRTHRCGDLNKSHIDKRVQLSGWVHRRRDHGGLVFIDLRDRFGITQLVFDPKIDKETHEKASQLRSEWVISIEGAVILRADGMNNPKLATGDIEVEVSQLSVLSRSLTPPFSIEEPEIEVREDLRLTYRYLDIRRGPLQKNLVLRHEVMQTLRAFLSSQDFIEITTPILSKSTPEGARDYLVPSRIHPGNAYALPQSPQIYKQLLMISGLDRYFQIATCFRDEDLRSDRQPEFTQLDLEWSFETPDTLIEMIEALMKKVFEKHLGISLITPFTRIPYFEALELYGTDKPDTRFALLLFRLDSIITRSDFDILKQEIEKGGCAKALSLPGGADLSRKQIDDLIAFARSHGIQGLAWMKVTNGSLTSNIAKYFNQDLQKELIEKGNLQEGDLLLIGAGPEPRVNAALDALRRKLGKDHNLIDENTFAFSWTVDFPLFSWNAEDNKLTSTHHPFTAPHSDDLANLTKDPLKIRSLAYDLILNGHEIGGGSQRIHDSPLQQEIFSLLDLDSETVKKRFGFFVTALAYGTPPHLGFAFGLDRLVMLLAQTEQIRDVIAFPKTQKASDLMQKAPSAYSKHQLEELKIIPTQIQTLSWDE